jgi:preprotein translocase subunit SecD
MYSQCGFQLSRNDDMTQYSGSSRTVSYIVAAIAVFAVATALFVFPEQYNRASAYVAGKTGFSFGQLSGKTPFVFGLDLRGGAHLVYEADTKTVAADEVSDAIEGVRDVIERRVNSLGVSEPIIQTNRSGDAWRIIVELAGVKDVSQAISAIGETPVLEFKEESGVPPRALTEEEKTNLKNANVDQKNRAVDLLTKALLQQQNY